MNTIAISVEEVFRSVVLEHDGNHACTVSVYIKKKLYTHQIKQHDSHIQCVRVYQSVS
jgi:hypothetical protein